MIFPYKTSLEHLKIVECILLFNTQGFQDLRLYLKGCQSLTETRRKVSIGCKQLCSFNVDSSIVSAKFYKSIGLALVCCQEGSLLPTVAVRHERVRQAGRGQYWTIIQRRLGSPPNSSSCSWSCNKKGPQCIYVLTGKLWGSQETSTWHYYVALG